MDIVEFANQLDSQERDELIERWIGRLREMLAEQALFFARYAEHINEPLRSQYVQLLEQMLGELPEDAPIVVSSSLLNRLHQLLPPDQHPELEQKVRASSRVPA